MQIQARQAQTNLKDEINNTIEDLELWKEIRVIQDSLREGVSEHANIFFNNITSQRNSFDLLITIDRSNRICAINNAGKSLLGKPYKDLLNNIPNSWLASVLENDYPQTIGWQKLPAVNQLYGRKAGSSPIESLYQIGIAVAVRDSETEEAIGILVSIINWSHFQSILDSVQIRFREQELDTGYAFLTGNDSDTLIGHKDRTIYGDKAVSDYHLDGLYEKFEDHYEGIYNYNWLEGDKTVALAPVNTEILGTQIDWKLGVGINDKQIFSPIKDLKLYFFLISLATAVVVGAISLLFGKRVSMSLQEFTRLARDASRGSFVKMAKTRSHDELGNLAQAFNEMLVSFRAQMPFVNIPNPYVVGTPIRSSSMFYGRQEDLHWLGGRLERAGNIMILLYGDRRVGKTSLLHQIYGLKASEKVLPFFLDTQQLLPEISKDSDFYHVLTRDILSQIPEKLPGLKAPFIAADRFTPQTFRNLLEFLQDAEPDRQPVLLFDEIENLEYKLARGDLTSDILLFLAGLMDSRLRISFVVTGSEPLEGRRLPDWSILEPKTISRKIGLLAHEDALRLIEEPAQGYFIFDEGIPEKILRMTAGHPYYTQVVCQTQIDFLNQNHEFAVGSDQLDKITQIVMENPPPPLNHVWESFSRIEKLSIAVTANCLDNDVDFMGIEEMMESMPDEMREPVGKKANFLSAMESLVHQNWVEKSDRGSYRFRIDLLRLWLRREHTVWHLADELQQGTLR
ncbi:MAG: ATP-binding protein [Acidobacteriota bacterium]